MTSTDPAPDLPTPGSLSISGPTRPWIVLGLLMAISFSHLFHRVGLSPFTGEMIERWGYSDSTMGLIQTAFLLTYTAAMTPGGWLADRVGTWRTLLVVSAGTGVFGALIGGARWLELGSGLAVIWMMTVLGCMGVCAAPNFPSTSRTVSAWYRPEKQVLANAMVTAAAIAGAAASPVVLTALASRIGWPAALGLTGTLGLGITALWAGLGRESPRDSPLRRPMARESVRWRRFLRHRGILCLAISYGCLGYSQYVFFYWLNHYFREILRYTESESARYTSIPILGMMVSTPLGGIACSLLAERRGVRRVFPVCSMLFMVSSALSLAAGIARRESGPVEIVFWFTLACAFIGMAEGPFWTTAARLGGRFAATSGGVVNTVGNLGGLLATFFTPVIAHLAGGSDDRAQGWASALIASSIVIGAGGLLWLAVDPDDPYVEKAAG